VSVLRLFRATAGCLVAAMLVGCASGGDTKKGKKNIVNSKVAESSSEEGLMGEPTVKPVGNCIWSLTTDHYYDIDGKLYERACSISGKEIKNSEGTIGKVGDGKASVTFHDTFYNREVTLEWKIGGDGIWSLESDNDVYGRYRKMKEMDGSLFNFSTWYEIEDGRLVYIDWDGERVPQEVSAEAGKPWTFGTNDSFNFVAKKDSRGNYYYFQDLVNAD